MDTQLTDETLEISAKLAWLIEIQMTKILSQRLLKGQAHESLCALFREWRKEVPYDFEQDGTTKTEPTEKHGEENEGSALAGVLTILSGLTYVGALFASSAHERSRRDKKTR